MFVIEVGTVSKALRRVTRSKSMCEPQETASRRDRTVQGHNLDDSSTFADLGSSPSTLTAGGSSCGLLGRPGGDLALRPPAARGIRGAVAGEVPVVAGEAAVELCAATLPRLRPGRPSVGSALPTRTSGVRGSGSGHWVLADHDLERRVPVDSSLGAGQLVACGDVGPVDRDDDTVGVVVAAASIATPRVHRQHDVDRAVVELDVVYRLRAAARLA